MSKAVIHITPRPGFRKYEDTIPEWYAEAPCLGLTDLMFDEDREEEAKAVCSRCPFKQPCLDLAIENQEEYGVWGMTTPKERLKGHVHD